MGRMGAELDRKLDGRTLTEMLINCNTHFELDQIATAKAVFKEWLETVGLPQYYNPDGQCFNVTESLRKLLVILVDEP